MRKRIFAFLSLIFLIQACKTDINDYQINSLFKINNRQLWHIYALDYKKIKIPLVKIRYATEHKTGVTSAAKIGKTTFFIDVGRNHYIIFETIDPRYVKPENIKLGNFVNKHFQKTNFGDEAEKLWKSFGLNYFEEQPEVWTRNNETIFYFHGYLDASPFFLCDIAIIPISPMLPQSLKEINK
jgi:hypothetical protein